MSPRPARPKLYHITHVDNLAALVAEGALLSDAAVRARGGPRQAIGMSEIKRRRLEVLEVACHAGTKVGDYVPFYFCARSVMLYVLHRANHLELAYRGGQDPIVHLETDLHEVLDWAARSKVRWAFSLSNAGASYTEFRSREADLDELDWGSIAATDFRPAAVKEGKQAEFLVYERFPIDLVERVGVRSDPVASMARETLAGSACRATVEILPQWYY